MMFLRMAIGSIFAQRGKMLLVSLSMLLGSSLFSAMLAVMFDVGDKVNAELKTYGANITVLPKTRSLLSERYGIEEGGGYLNESEIGNIKTIFWAFNIVDFAPYLEVGNWEQGTESIGSPLYPEQYARSPLPIPHSPFPLVGTWFRKDLSLPTGETVSTGIANMKAWWQVRGRWAERENEAMAGEEAARKLGLDAGDDFTVTTENGAQVFTITGIFSAGSGEDDSVYVSLETAQKLSGLEGKVDRIEVSALTTPDNELSRRAAVNPQSLSVKEWETWYCTAYVSAICYQIDEVITGSLSKPVRQIAQSEGAVLEKIELLMLLVTVASLAAAALAISNLVTASVLERKTEIGLLKALGAGNFSVTALTLTSLLITAALGGLAGSALGFGFAQIIGHTVFESAISWKPQTLPVTAGLVILVTLAGSIPAVRLLLSLRPAEALHGR